MGKVVIALIEARAKGLKFYFTGIPCRHGHVAPRRVLDRGCTACRSRIDRDNYYKHQAKKIAKSARWNRANPEKVKAWVAANPEAIRKSLKKYRAANRDKINAYRRERWATNPNFRLRMILTSRINQAIWYDCGVKSAKTLELVGCSIPELRTRLEAQFQPGMDWDNPGYGKGMWHIDHKVPCAAFDLTDPEQQRKCFHYSNLQPLWSEDNFRKNARMPDVPENSLAGYPA